MLISSASEIIVSRLVMHEYISIYSILKEPLQITILIAYSDFKILYNEDVIV